MTVINGASLTQKSDKISNYIYSNDSLARYFNISGPERIKAMNGAGLVMGNSFKVPLIGLTSAKERNDITTEIEVSTGNDSSISFVIDKEFYKDYAVDNKADLAVSTLIKSSDYIEGIVIEIINKTNAYIFQNVLLNASTNGNMNTTQTAFTAGMISDYKTKLKKAKAMNSESSIILSSKDTNDLAKVDDFAKTASIFATKVISEGDDMYRFQLNGLKVLAYDYDRILEGVIDTGDIVVDAIDNNDGLAVFAGKNSVIGAVDAVTIGTEELSKTNRKAKLLFGSALAGFTVGLPQAFTQEITVG